MADDSSSPTRFIYPALVIIPAIVCFGIGGNVPLPKLEALYSGLQGVAAVVFGVMGAWLALVYPDALDSLYKEQSLDRNQPAVNRVEKLVSAMAVSTIVLAATFAFPLITAVFNGRQPNSYWTFQYQTFCFSAYAALTMLLIIKTLETVGVAFMFLWRLRRTSAKERLKRSIMGTNSRQTDKRD
ncbi:MAG: hypothetical protein ACOY33_07070 [Pseudomonadota bacterium]